MCLADNWCTCPTLSRCTDQADIARASLTSTQLRTRSQPHTDHCTPPSTAQSSRRMCRQDTDCTPSPPVPRCTSQRDMALQTQTSTPAGSSTPWHTDRRMSSAPAQCSCRSSRRHTARCSWTRTAQSTRRTGRARTVCMSLLPPDCTDPRDKAAPSATSIRGDSSTPRHTSPCTSIRQDHRTSRTCLRRTARCSWQLSPRVNRRTHPAGSRCTRQRQR